MTTDATPGSIESAGDGVPRALASGSAALLTGAAEPAELAEADVDGVGEFDAAAVAGWVAVDAVDVVGSAVTGELDVLGGGFCDAESPQARTRVAGRTQSRSDGTACMVRSDVSIGVGDACVT